MQIQRQITIDASPEEVWQVLGHQFDQVSLWASSVSHSAARSDGKRVSSAPASGRVCETDLGPFRESILEFDEERKVLAYEASGEKMPSFVHNLKNRWSLTALSGSRTRVDMLMTADLAFPFRLFMPPLMKLQMGRVLSFAIEELKHYVETGQPHPRKVKADLAAARKAA
ncbi:MAG: SRPBCC family protein [Acidobacteriota bacterium]